MQYTRAHLIETRAAEGTARRYRFRASSTAVARDGATIPASEWNTDNFMRNPVVLLSHDYSSMPIGRAVSLERDEDGLIAEIEYDGDDEKARHVMRKLDGGFMHAVSVGFRGSVERDGSDLVYRNVELLEISNVAVPSDPNALAMRSHDGDESPFPYIARLEARIEALEALSTASAEVTPEASRDTDPLIDMDLAALRRYL